MNWPRRMLEILFSAALHVVGLGVALGYLQHPARSDAEKIWLALIAAGIVAHGVRVVYLLIEQD